MQSLNFISNALKWNTGLFTITTIPYSLVTSKNMKEAEDSLEKVLFCYLQTKRTCTVSAK